MQLNKSTKKIEQIEKVSKNEKEIGDNIWSLMDKFGLETIFKPFNKVKRSGALVSTIGMTLIILPFVAKDSILSFIKSVYYNGEVGEKDAFYSMKNNSNINWRILLFGIAKRFIALLSSEQNEGGIRALIFDDTSVKKTGKTIERTGYIHDHVQGFIFQYFVIKSGSNCSIID